MSLKAIMGAIIVTMDRDRRIIPHGTVVIRDGIIEEVGPSDQVSLPPGAEVLKERQFVVFPGFINTHTHCALTVLRGQAEDVNTVQAVYGLMAPFNRLMTEKETYDVSRMAMAELLKFGSTTIVENSTHMDSVAQAAQDMGIRAFLGGGKIHDAHLEPIRENRYEYSDSIGRESLRQAVEFVETWDGRENGRIRCLLAPHATDTVSPNLWHKVKSEADRLGMRITTHVSQNLSEVGQVQKISGLRPVTYLKSLGVLDSRFIAAHGVFAESD